MDGFIFIAIIIICAFALSAVLAVSLCGMPKTKNKINKAVFDACVRRKMEDLNNSAMEYANSGDYRAWSSLPDDVQEAINREAAKRIQ